MTRIVPILVLLAVVAAAVVASVWWSDGRPRSAETPVTAGVGASAEWYTCGMHPEVIESEPGTCPKCGMNLVPMAADRVAALGLGSADEKGEPPDRERRILYWKSSMIPGEISKEPGKDSMGMDLVPVYEDEVATAGTIRIDPVTEQNMGVRLAEVMRGPLVRTVRTVGNVETDETGLASVTTKVDGWIEELHVEQTGAEVHRGDPLFELYSPALFSAQEEYLAALRATQRGPGALPAEGEAGSLVADARTRLEYFDVPESDIRRLERTGKVRKTVSIEAPFTGVVLEKHVTEGQMVKAGNELLRIADLSTVWVIARVFEHDLPFVEVGQEALMTLSYLPGRTFRGRVTYVYPVLEEKARELPIRIEFHNPGYELKPGMYATVELGSKLADDAVLVPDVAVLDTGKRTVVFTSPKPGRFAARDVVVGARGRGNVRQVLSGLAPGEKVVVSGQFLLDSESRLREAALKFLEPGETSGAEAVLTAPHEDGEAAAIAGAERLYYACPMPEHVDTLYDQPGRCPICGMALVPVRRHADHVDRPVVSHWTCPMPEHGQVREEGPGKCPICGMSLIPVTRPPGETAVAPSALAPAAESPEGAATPGDEP